MKITARVWAGLFLLGGFGAATADDATVRSHDERLAYVDNGIDRRYHDDLEREAELLVEATKAGAHIGIMGAPSSESLAMSAGAETSAAETTVSGMSLLLDLADEWKDLSFPARLGSVLSAWGIVVATRDLMDVPQRQILLDIDRQRADHLRQTVEEILGGEVELTLSDLPFYDALSPQDLVSPDELIPDAAEFLANTGISTPSAPSDPKCFSVEYYAAYRAAFARGHVSYVEGLERMRKLAATSSYLQWFNQQVARSRREALESETGSALGYRSAQIEWMNQIVASMPGIGIIGSMASVVDAIAGGDYDSDGFRRDRALLGLEIVANSELVGLGIAFAGWQSAPEDALPPPPVTNLRRVDTR